MLGYSWLLNLDSTINAEHEALVRKEIGATQKTGEVKEWERNESAFHGGQNAQTLEVPDEKWEQWRWRGWVICGWWALELQQRFEKNGGNCEKTSLER